MCIGAYNREMKNTLMLNNKNVFQNQTLHPRPEAETKAGHIHNMEMQRSESHHLPGRNSPETGSILDLNPSLTEPIYRLTNRSKINIHAQNAPARKLY